MDNPRRMIFVGTARSGLGHLRRIATIAGQLARGAPHCERVLMTNAPPGGLSSADLRVFSGIWQYARQDMAKQIARAGCGLVVLDTVRLPGFEVYTGPAVLVLREMPDDRVPGFRRAGGRVWDKVVVPNPADHWLPRAGPDFARKIEPVGWIRRPAGKRGADPSAGIVLATGGGGTAETRALLYPLLDAVIAETRCRARRPFRLRQALGPRADGHALSGADDVFDPGADLNDVFRCADAVISTAGYNSVLELAGTETPALLAAIPRSLDDQRSRVDLWGPRLGAGLDPDRIAAAAGWLAGVIDWPRRRPIVDLGLDGAERAAAALTELLCPVS